MVTTINGKKYKIIDIEKIKKKNLYYIIGVGDNFLIEKKILKDIISKNIKLKLTSIISSKSKISKNVQIGQGSVILANSFVGYGSKIGEHCIINSSTSIDHDNFFGDFCSTGPGVITGGNVKLRELSHLGIGCVVKNNVSIDKNTICGGKSYVNKDCKKDSVYYGIPIKFVKTRKLGEKYL